MTKARKYAVQAVVVFFDLSGREPVFSRSGINTGHFRQKVWELTKICRFLCRLAGDLIKDVKRESRLVLRVFVQLQNLPYFWKLSQPDAPLIFCSV